MKRACAAAFAAVFLTAALWVPLHLAFEHHHGELTDQAESDHDAGSSREPHASSDHPGVAFTRERPQNSTLELAIAEIAVPEFSAEPLAVERQESPGLRESVPRLMRRYTRGPPLHA